VPAATGRKKKTAAVSAPKAAKPPTPMPLVVDLKAMQQAPLDAAFFRVTFKKMFSMTTEGDLFASNSFQEYAFVGDAILQAQAVIHARHKQAAAVKAGNRPKAILHDIVQCYVKGEGPATIFFDKMGIANIYDATHPSYARLQGLSPGRKADIVEAMIAWTQELSTADRKKLCKLHTAILRELLKEGDTICKRDHSL
jgi:hypothetical protein